MRISAISIYSGLKLLTTIYGIYISTDMAGKAEALQLEILRGQPDEMKDRRLSPYGYIETK